MLKEYLKLSRSFNAALTGVAPVLGAISNDGSNLLLLFVLFLIGFLGHSYGFALNDILDLKVDKLSKELTDRPLISGSMTMKQAWIFVLFNLISAFLLALGLAVYTSSFYPLLLLALSAGLITTYDFVSKRFPGADIFVGGGIFALILYGVTTVPGDIESLAILVCVLGTIQVLFMQFIAGGLKDIDHDSKAGANTLAVKLGVREHNGVLTISPSFKVLAYTIQGVDIIMIFLPFLIIFSPLSTLNYIQMIVLAFCSVVMLWISKQLLSLQTFDRDTLRKFIGLHYLINYSLVPIMLIALTPWVALLIFIFPLGFLSSNLVLHGTLLHPKTM